MKYLTRVVLVLVAACAIATAAGAQGVTTGQIAGVVQDAQGLALPGASILAVHEPSGTNYEAVTREDGHFYDSGHARRRALHLDRDARGLPAADPPRRQRLARHVVGPHHDARQRGRRPKR